LIFARPSGTAPIDGWDNVVGSELVFCDARSGATWLATDTAEIAEMEPAITPDGSAVVFADWQSGTVFQASITREGTP
jgi:hypothetical protein